MIFKRFEPLTKGEKKFLLWDVNIKIVETVILTFCCICIVIALLFDKMLNSYGGLIMFSVFIFLTLAFPYLFFCFFVDVRNNKKQIFTFLLTKKKADINDEESFFFFYHYKKSYKVNIQNIEEFYNEIAVGDIIELHQLPKSGEFIKIQKIENTPKTL